MAITHYTPRTLHGVALLGASQPRHKCTACGDDETPLPINLSTYHSETGPGLIALALFFVRFLLVWLLGLASGWLSLPLDSRLQKLRGSGLDRVLQAHARLAPTLTFWS